MDWKDKVTDPDEIKVFEALDKPEFTWRTVSGIARQTKIAPERVEGILAKYTPSYARFSTVGVSGSALVGLVEKVGT